jgi:hypothetical protein
MDALLSRQYIVLRECLRDTDRVVDGMLHRLDALEARASLRDKSHDEPVSNAGEAIGQHVAMFDPILSPLAQRIKANTSQWNALTPEQQRAQRENEHREIKRLNAPWWKFWRRG